MWFFRFFRRYAVLFSPRLFLIFFSFASLSPLRFDYFRFRLSADLIFRHTLFHAFRFFAFSLLFRCFLFRLFAFMLMLSSLSDAAAFFAAIDISPTAGRYMLHTRMALYMSIRYAA